MDENLAAMSGMYSLALRTWWPAALRVCGLRSRQLPELRPLGGVASRTNAGALEFGLPKGIPVVLAGNDQTAGAYAARLDENHGLLLTLGTAQATYAYTDKMTRPDPTLFRGPFPFRGYYRMAADSCGGSIINWAKTILAGCETDKKFFNLAARSPSGCRGLKFEPNCHESQGIWRHIGLHHTSADFARSVLESLTHRLSEMIQQLGVRLDRTQVLVAGGGSENPLWIRILSETLGVRLKVTEGRPVVGAGRMALKTLLDIQR
jgi:sugar (pentulose or hexulose) kinase